LDILNLVGGGYHVSHTFTLRQPSRTRTGVYTSYETGNSEKQLAVNDDNLFKISTFGPIREQRNLTADWEQ